MNIKTINHSHRPIIVITALLVFLVVVLQLSQIVGSTAETSEGGGYHSTTATQDEQSTVLLEDFVSKPDSEFWQHWIDFAGLPQPGAVLTRFQDADNDRD